MSLPRMAASWGTRDRSPTSPHSAPRFPPLSTTSPHQPPQSGRDPSLGALRLGFRDDPRPDLGTQRAGDGRGQRPGRIRGQRGHTWKRRVGQRPGEQRHQAIRRPLDVHGALEPRPARVRRWLMPTSLSPPASTSPGPTPAKHTSGHHPVHAIVPRCTVTPSSAPAMCEPSHTIDAPMSSPTPTSCSTRVGTTTSNHTSAPGSTNTTPPPLRRRTTSIPAAAQAATSSTSSRWVDPSTIAGRSTSNTQTSGCGSSPIVRAWNSAAEPPNVRTRAPGTASTPPAPAPR